MNTILLVSCDEDFWSRLRSELRGQDHFVRWRPGDALLYPSAASNRWVLVDCRTRSPAEATAELERVRRHLGEDVRCAAIVAGLALADIEVIATIREQVTDILIADSESVTDVIRAVVNDSSQTIAAAIALTSLLRNLPQEAHEIVRSVLASGLQASSVKEVAAKLHRDRSAIGRGLRRASGATAKTFVELAKASYIVTLLRGSSISLGGVVAASRFKERRWLDALLTRVFGLTAAQVRNDPGDSNPSAWLALHLSNHQKRCRG